MASVGVNLLLQIIKLREHPKAISTKQGGGVTDLVAQVMTRGMVKSKLMHERKWVIRSQAPDPLVAGVQFID